MIEKLENYMRSLELLTDEEVRIILDGTVVESFRKGHYLLKKGQVANKCYFVLEGCVREYLLADGEERTTAFFLEGDAVSSFASVSNNAPSNYYLQCIEDCTLTVSDQALEQEMCDKIPRLRSIIQQEVEKITGQIHEQLTSFIANSPEERYMNLMETKPEIFNRFPQHQIASYIGVQPESLSRIRRRIQGRKK